MNEQLVEKAQQHLSQILKDALCIEPSEHVVVLYDEDSELARIITEGYRRALPEAEFMLFSAHTAEEIIAKVHSLQPRDSVFLVQSKSFRLNEFRFRIELFQRDLKTIEHIHLGRMSADQYETYINTLAYDKEYYHTTGHFLKKLLDASARTVVRCHGGTELIYDTSMEDAKLNIGDYSEMKNKGGTFPIGEVFSEAKDFSKVNGEAMIYAFADMSHLVHIYTPFKVYIKESILSAGPDAPQEFHDLLAMIAQDEPITMREFGLSLNPAQTREHFVSDITAFERIRGLHVSLGSKHTVYAKPGFHKKKSRYHIDVFFDVSSIEVDGKNIFNGKEFLGVA